MHLPIRLGGRHRAFVSAADHGEPDATAPSDRTGLLIIRAWVEEGSSERLRADLRTTTDVSAGIERTATLVRAEEVGAAVQNWLAEILGEPGAVQPSA